jgi:sugar-specific transcriptional regulator TrmB
VNNISIDKLVNIGLSEYEAKAYLALLKKSPLTGRGLARLSGVPRSMITHIADGLASRGAVVTLPTGDTIEYAPVPAEEFLDRLHQEHEELMAALKDELGSLTETPDLDCVWNIRGQANIIARAKSILGQARRRIYLATWPATFPALRPALEGAIGRGVQVVIYTTGRLDLPGGRVVITTVSEKVCQEKRTVGLIVIRDGQELLIGERLDAGQAQASWTHNPTLVAIIEHHLVRGGRRRFLIPGNAAHEQQEPACDPR